MGISLLSHLRPVLGSGEPFIDLLGNALTLIYLAHITNSERHRNVPVTCDCDVQLQKSLNIREEETKVDWAECPLCKAIAILYSRGVYLLLSTHFLFTILTCAHRMREQFCPQHWLLCHLGLY